MTDQNRQTLEQIAAAAVASERTTGCPAELTAAQAILESGWLAHAPRFNCFGIKWRPRHTTSQVLMTTEYIDGKPIRKQETFAAFSSL